MPRANGNFHFHDAIPLHAATDYGTDILDKGRDLQFKSGVKNCDRLIGKLHVVHEDGDGISCHLLLFDPSWVRANLSFGRNSQVNM